MSTPQIQTPISLANLVTPTVQNATNLLEQSRRAEIASQEAFDNATDLIKICTAQETRADEAMHRLIDPLMAHVKWIRSEFEKIFSVLAEAKRLLKEKALAWKQGEDARLAAEAEAARKLAEEQAIAAAEAAQAAGDTERAEALLQVAADTPELVETVHGRGNFTGASAGSKFTWKGSVVDTKALCRAIADGTMPENLIKEFSRSKLNAWAQSHGKEEVVHGVKCVHQEDLNVR